MNDKPQTPSLGRPDFAPLEIPERQPTRARTWTGFVEWHPSWLLECAAGVMGAIDLDPASSDAQQQQPPPTGELCRLRAEPGCWC
jgi:hypothetical protein